MNPDTPPLPFADFDRWITESWQTDQRYYQADIMQDLFGTWLVKRSWGGLGSRRGNSKTTSATDHDHALKLLSEVAKRRQQRGYVRC
jgi:predicted DNA-binding WGR domain protein